MTTTVIAAVSKSCWMQNVWPECKFLLKTAGWCVWRASREQRPLLEASSASAAHRCLNFWPIFCAGKSSRGLSLTIMCIEVENGVIELCFLSYQCHRRAWRDYDSLAHRLGSSLRMNIYITSVFLTYARWWDLNLVKTAVRVWSHFRWRLQCNIRIQPSFIPLEMQPLTWYVSLQLLTANGQ